MSRYTHGRYYLTYLGNSEYTSVWPQYMELGEEWDMRKRRKGNETKSKESKYWITWFYCVASFKKALVSWPDLIVLDQRRSLSALAWLYILGEHSIVLHPQTHGFTFYLFYPNTIFKWLCKYSRLQRKSVKHSRHYCRHKQKHAD